MAMNAVCDHADGDAIVGEGRAHGSRGAMTEAGHRAVQMRDQRRAGVDALYELLVGGVRVAEAHDHAVLDQAPDAIQGAVHLGGQGHQAHRIVLEERIEQIGGSVFDRGGAMRSGPPQGQERALEVQPQGLRSRDVATGEEGLAGPRVDVRGGADQGGQERDDARRRQPRRQMRQGLGACAHLHAETAVDLQVDEAGRHDRGVVDRRGQVLRPRITHDVHDRSMTDDDGTGHQLVIEDEAAPHRKQRCVELSRRHSGLDSHRF
jgi:hypothetical protein